DIGNEPDASTPASLFILGTLGRNDGEYLPMIYKTDMNGTEASTIPIELEETLWDPVGQRLQMSGLAARGGKLYISVPQDQKNRIIEAYYADHISRNFISSPGPVQIWHAASPVTPPPGNPAPATIYQTMRYNAGGFSYLVPIDGYDPTDSYTLVFFVAAFTAED